MNLREEEITGEYKLLTPEEKAKILKEAIKFSNQ
jgi:dihydrodipicolinate synthase/N-acetylneuraminate lyase